jgi:outer membrane immunogenic protein
MDGATVQTCTGVDLCAGAQSTPISSATTRDFSLGLLLGAGVEYRLNEHWNGRLEYQFVNFRKELALPPVDGPGWDHDVDVHALKFGLSYRF